MRILILISCCSTFLSGGGGVDRKNLSKLAKPSPSYAVFHRQRLNTNKEINERKIIHSFESTIVNNICYIWDYKTESEPGTKYENLYELPSKPFLLTYHFFSFPSSDFEE